jgi:Ni/Co efflux regulator RcnB
VKKVVACVLVFFLALAVSAFPAVARADTNAARSPAQTNANKVRKGYVRHQKRVQKSALKGRNKTTKRWKRQHRTG